MRLASLVAVALFAFACAAEDPTGVLVVIDGEPAVRSIAEELEITVRGGDVSPDVIVGTRIVSFERERWPVLVGVEPRLGDASRVWGLEIRVTDGGSTRLVHRIQGGFARGRVKVIHLLLQAACIDPADLCDTPDRTCVDGECRTVRHVDPATLPDLVGDPRRDGGTDAGQRDGAAVECTGPAECDDGNDCTVDACTDGACTNVERSCPDDGDPCTAAECDPVVGDCVHVSMADGAGCGGSSQCCGGACLDVSSDETACGACGTTCGGNQQCVAGSCTCEAGFEDCDRDGTSCEARLASDPMHCGSCGNTCSGGTPACLGGTCGACATAADCPSDARPCIGEPTCTGGSCDYPFVSGMCLVGGECYAAGAPSPSNPCLACDPSTVMFNFSARSAGTSCNDGDFCTEPDACNGSGTCTGPARACSDALSCTADSCADGSCRNVPGSTSCAIAGACYSGGASNPSNLCQVCTPTTSRTSWSTLSCPITTCSATTHCVIGGVCYENLQYRPGDDCEHCRPTVSFTSWTNRPNGSSCGSGSGVCSSGNCVSSDAGTADAGRDAGTGGS